MSRVLPILFNTDMVRAILDGRKTVTRRLIKPQLPDACPSCKCMNVDYIYDNNAQNIYCARCGEPFYPEKKSPYQAGDILYVRETWSEWTDGYVYRAWTEPFPQAGCYPTTTWHPSIHMPKEAARIWLRVMDVKVERLQDMPHDGALKEGIHYCVCPDGFSWKTGADIHSCYVSPMGAMEALWDSTIKKKDIAIYGWDANPWVWVIEFARCEKPESETDISRLIEGCRLQKEHGEAGRDGNGACLGFGKPFDDEPIEQCKQCIAYTGWEREAESYEQ